jgi:hypothetical protein
MAQHRKRPAHRPARMLPQRSRAPGPSSRRLGAAVRRVMVTPTFAAGLGVVVAAVLAFHVSGTVFRYSTPIWRSSARPPATPAGRAGGHAAVVKPGRPLRTARPRATAAGPAGTSSARRTDTRGPAPPAIAYATDHTFPGGFAGQLTLTFPGGRVPAHWRLWFSYPARRVYAVFGGRWEAHGEHAAAATGDGAQLLSPTGVIRVAFWVSGPPAPPAGCSFNHAACRAG